MDIEYMGKKEIIELFSKYDFIVKDIEIVDKDQETFADVNIIVSDTGLYRIDTVDNIVKKVKSVKEELTKGGLIDDIMFGDLYKGSWRILVYFKDGL